MSEQTVILWFRQDLRIADNPALVAAAQRGTVLPVFILDDTNARQWRAGAASRWWLHRSLLELDKALKNSLQVYHGDPLQLIPQLCKRSQASAVFWNRCYEPWQVSRDKSLKVSLEDCGIGVESFNGSLLWEPWQIAKKDGTPYRVFTPFYNKGCLPAPAPRSPLPRPRNLQLTKASQPESKISGLRLLPDIDWTRTMAEVWQPGQQGAEQQLRKFLDSGLDRYKQGRDFPALNAVSRLSPHLHFGEISPNQVWYQVQHEYLSKGLDVNGEHFHRELGWREFSYHLLYHFPTLSTANFQPKFDYFPWQDDAGAFAKWCRGQTGYPIVDAGMRELWQTGYMHNRVRMIVASFLCKNLLIHWRKGAEWFWDCLVDADLANNNASWQWVAGSGADAAPFFRIFNPVTQGRKFDPNGDYIRRYVPEIAALPDTHLHDPSSAPSSLLEDAGIKLGNSYPSTIVDLKSTRTRALQAFQSLNHSWPSKQSD